MRLVFGPGDHEEYGAARERLRLLVVAWARRRGVQVDPALVAAALDHRHRVDGRLGHWTRAHLAEALAVWFPRHVALDEDEDERAAVPAALHAVVGLLAEQGWLDPLSDPPALLHAQIDDSTPALHDAFSDERNHDLGTFWAVQLRRHDVSTADPYAVAVFLDAVRRGEIPIDRDALAEVTRRENRRRADDGPPPLAPVLLLGAAALLAAADSSVGLIRLRALTRWVGTGRPLTGAGRLHLDDALDLGHTLGLDGFSRSIARTADDLPEITMLVRWARHARLVRVHRACLVPVRAAAPLLGRPIELWRRAFDALDRLGEYAGGSDVFGAPSLFGMSLGEAVPILLRDLYAAGGGAVPVERFHRLVRDSVSERYGRVAGELSGDTGQRLWRRDVTALLDALELLGAVTVEESLDGAELERIAGLAGRDDPDPTLVALTPIGLWAVRETLVEQGGHAPLVGELAGQDIEYLCVRLAGVRTEVVEAELACWVRAREPRRSAEELTRFLGRTDDPTHREFARFALVLAGAALRAFGARARK